MIILEAYGLSVIIGLPEGDLRHCMDKGYDA